MTITLTIAYYFTQKRIKSSGNSTNLKQIRKETSAGVRQEHFILTFDTDSPEFVKKRIRDRVEAAIDNRVRKSATISSCSIKESEGGQIISIENVRGRRLTGVTKYKLANEISWRIVNRSRLR